MWNAEVQYFDSGGSILLNTHNSNEAYHLFVQAVKLVKSLLGVMDDYDFIDAVDLTTPDLKDHVYVTAWDIAAKGRRLRFTLMTTEHQFMNDFDDIDIRVHQMIRDAKQHRHSAG